MKTPKCPNHSCQGSHFELNQIHPDGSDFKVSLIQCSSCGTVVGVLEKQSAAYLIERLAARLNVNL